MTSTQSKLRPGATRSRYRLPVGLATLTVGALLMSTSLPEPEDGLTGAPLRRFYEDNLAATRVAVLLGSLVVVAMILAVALLRRLLIEADADGALVDVVTVAGTLTTIWMWLDTATGSMVVLMAEGGRFPDYSDAALAELDLFARFSEGWGDIGMASVGLYVGAASLAAVRSKAFPRWIGHLGLVVAASALVSLVGALLPTSVPMTALFFVGLFGFVLWNLVLGVALCVSGLRGRSRHAEREAVAA